MTSAETVLGPTPQQKQVVAAHLVSTRDKLIETVKDLSPVQWSFQRAPGEWSAAAIVEHLAIIEGRVQMIIAALPDAGLAEPDRNDAAIDEFIVQSLPRRTPRVQAPDAALPKGECSPSEALQEFIHKRGETVDLLESAPCLRGRVLPHPIFGPWDGHQWILAAAAHTARHLEQIREIKSSEASPKYPAGSRL